MAVEERGGAGACEKILRPCAIVVERSLCASILPT